MTSLTVQVHLDGRGGWQVVLPEGVTAACDTLDDARRIAYLTAADQQPCEVIVQDAYHRVVQRERIDQDGASSLTPGPVTEEPL